MVQAPNLEHLFSYTADIEEPQQSVGAGPYWRIKCLVAGPRVAWHDPFYKLRLLLAPAALGAYSREA